MGMLTAEQLEELRAAAVSERGNRLDVAIRMTGMTQQQIAAAVGIRPGVLSTLKLARRKTLPTDVAERFAAFFGCQPEDLFPAVQVVRELLTLTELPRPVQRPRSRQAGTKRPRRAVRKQPDRIYPLPEHLDRQRLALSEMLTDARLTKGLTLQQLADGLNRTRQQIEQWESSAHHIRIDSLMEWADALGYRVCLEPLRGAADVVTDTRSDLLQ